MKGANRPQGWGSFWMAVAAAIFLLNLETQRANIALLALGLAIYAAILSVADQRRR